MKLRNRVRVNVRRPDGGEKAVLETVGRTLRSRLLKRLVGDRYSVLVLTPAGTRIDSMKIHETRDSGED